MERDNKILDFLAITGGATSDQIEHLIGSSRRYTGYIMKRLLEQKSASRVGRLASAKGGRPLTIWANANAQPERSLVASVLLSHYCLQHPTESFAQMDADGIRAFETYGSTWRLPADFDALMQPADRCKVVLPMDTEAQARSWLECHQQALRWSVLPRYELIIVTTTALVSLVDSLTGLDEHQRKTIDAELISLDVYRIHHLP